MTPPSTQSPDSSPVIPSVDLKDEVSLDHGQSVDGGVACCRQLLGGGGGLADCMGCLEYEWASFNEPLDEQERFIAMQVLSIIREAGQRGVAKADLQVCFPLSFTEPDV